MKTIKISPSILGVNKKDLISVCDSLTSSGASYIHVDVMDGKFVDNTSFIDGEIDILSNCVQDDILDVHLMCYDLEHVIPLYAKKHVKYISIHVESENIDQLIKCAELIRSFDIMPGIVINPDTDIHKILPLLKYFDLVLVMSVFPGKGGQTFIENSVEKISMLDNYRKKHNLGYQIEVDGGINKFTASICKDKGVDILVAGSYILKSENYKERIKSLL